MEEDISLFLHEMPIIRAFLKRIVCLLHGGHKHIYIGRVPMNTEEKQGKIRYSLHYACIHCRHFKWGEEVE